MIPKVIHYCWFGNNPKPIRVLKCIESWKKFCPDFEIKEWNESNCDINFYKYTQQAYEARKYSFVSDVFRLKIIYENGGIYLDTDVELIRKIDDLLIHKLFLGCEENTVINTGLGFGAVPFHNFIKQNLDLYCNNSFFLENGTFNLTPCPIYTTKLLIKLGIIFPINRVVTFNNITIYPIDYFCPKSWKTGKLKVTSRTYSIHHYDASWCDVNPTDAYLSYKKYLRRNFFKLLLVKLFGINFCQRMKVRLKHFLCFKF